MNQSSQMTLPEAGLEAIRRAQKIAVMTGAGISAESGIPTFREAQTGLWAEFRPEELATPEAFQRNPKLVWDWYQWRRSLIAKTQPNPGHYALVSLAEKVAGFTLITQNVDGFHALAGSDGVLELHGNIQRTKCFDKHHPVQDIPESDAVPPQCPTCPSLLRPDVVWFGEALPTETLAAASQAAQNCDVFFSIGTSSVVYPAADIAFQAIRQGAVTIEVNPAETPASQYFTYCLRGPSGQVLPKLIEQLWPDN